jgi:hypothetical protein
LPQGYSRWPYTDDFIEQPWFEYFAADGSISSTVGDMCAYARFILNRGVAPSGRILSDRAFARLTKPELNNYAYGLQVRENDGDTIISHGGAVAGFTTILRMHMNDGWAVVTMGNGGLDIRWNNFAIASVKAVFRNQPLPDPPATSDPTVISNAADYAGVFSSDAKTFEFAAAGNRLALKHNGGTVPLLRVQGDTFRVASGSLSKFFFVFARDGGKVTEVSWGPEWYIAAGYTGPKKFDTPSEYATYTGRYVNHNPEESVIRIYVRKGGLFLASGPGAGERLVPAGPATFRPAAPDFNPERYSFDSVVEGHALRLFASGMPMYRMEE